MADNYEANWPGRLAGFSFGRMEKVLPLQAADMIAYETFVHYCEQVNGNPTPKLRDNMAKLASEMPVYAGYYTYDALVEYANWLDG